MDKEIDTENLEKRFDELLLKDELNIDTIEEIMLDDIKKYKKNLILHIEELLATKIDEKKLIAKKKKNGKKKDLN